MTKIRSSLFMVIGIIACFLIETQGMDKYTDENRPYEFGFTIDGEQHRHEKKDKNGIIQGEFGFITADGVYHVTVYATDEQGRFKIISMKNIRVKPYPTGPARQGHSLSFPSSPSTSTANAITPAKPLAPPHEQSPIMPAMPQIKLKSVKIEPPAKSCSHCSLPTTTTQAPPLLSPSYNNAPGITSDQHGIVPVSNYPGQETSVPSNVGGLIGFGPSQQNNINYPQTNVEKGPANNQPNNYPGSAQSYPEQQNVGQDPATRLSQINPDQQYAQGSPQEGNYPSNQNNLGQYGGMNAISPQSHVQGPSQSTSKVYPQDNTESHYNPQNAVGFTGQKKLAPQYPTQNTESQPKNLQRNQYGERIPKQFNPNEQSGFPGLDEAIKSQPNVNEPPPREPKLIAAQMQIVDKNTDVRAKRPGEQEGLPQGLNKSNMEQLLYTFNYTLGFHGHFEEGYRNGAKQGYYFVTGRNGVRTRVDYVADDTGFHPKISQEVFEVSSDDVPKPETERDEKYGLRGYEFKWLYYPVGS